ncbi:MAG: hypothetical protein WCC48_07500 [Anaeromyxobacteraceae bacterium]
MLDAYVIDEIRRRERERGREIRPTAEIPAPGPPGTPGAPTQPPSDDPDHGDPDRGVVIIDYA